jgi:hypothetical protein
VLLLDELTTFSDEYDQVILSFLVPFDISTPFVFHLDCSKPFSSLVVLKMLSSFIFIGAGPLQNSWNVILFMQMGVVNAVKNCVAGTGDVAALRVTHRLKELKYADEAIYMDDGRMIHGDVSSVAIFLKDKQSEYLEYLNFWMKWILQKLIVFRRIIEGR